MFGRDSGRFTYIFKDQGGMSLIEVMIATLIFIIIMLGGMNYFVLPQSMIVREKTRRLAILAAHRKIETLTALDYDKLKKDLSQSKSPVSLGKVKGWLKTTITFVDDPADGQQLNDLDKDLVDYKTIAIEISWVDGNQQEILLTTNVSKFGK